MKKMRRGISVLLILTMVLGMAQMAFAATPKVDVSSTISGTGKYLLSTVKEPTLGSIGGEWAILGLARSGYEVPQSYYDAYYDRITKELESSKGELTKTKYTEYSRLIIALTAIGKDVTNVAGYNLLEKIADFDNVKKQGINGPIYALIAFDSHEYAIPKVAGVSTQNTRDMMIDFILSKEMTDAAGVKGGFALNGDVADPDITGMALQALAKYQDQSKVKVVIDRAMTALQKLQLTGGGFATGGVETSESISQVIAAKSTLGMDASDNVSAIMKYASTGGGFKHLLTAEVNQMGTEQCFYALVAYDRLGKGQNDLYDMTDVKLTKTGAQTGANTAESTKPTPNQINATLNGNYIAFDQPPVNVNGSILVPMSPIFAAMGATVQWDGKAKKVTGTLEHTTVILAIGSKEATVNGIHKSLEVPAQIMGGRTMVPIRFISESLNAKVTWDQSTKTVIIVK